MKKFVCGIIVGSICTLSVGSLAGGIWDNISVLRNDIKVVVNGNEVTADNFLYQDTTYLPLRAVSTALGENVEYDEQTNTAYIGESEDMLLNNESNFTGKYNPKDYENILIEKGFYLDASSIILINNKYYILNMDCKNFLRSNNINFREDYDFESMEIIYTISGKQKKFNLTYNDNEQSYIPFDDFVDEILPYVE